jgi:hypothetical protein
MSKILIKRVILSAVMFLGITLPGKSVVPIAKNAKKIKFAGRMWAVKEFTGFKVGPGPNLFSKENVWVDKNGYLHLKIYKDNQTGKIYCAEIYSLDTFLYGTFEIELAKIDYNRFPLNAVLGIFTYRGKGEEIDLEFTYMFWTNNFANYSVQPLPPVYKFTPDLSKNTTHSITWHKERVEFKSTCNSKTYQRKFYNSQLPAKANGVKFRHKVISSKPARFHMNLWFHHKSPPPMQYISKKYKNNRDLEEFEIVVKNFKYSSAGNFSSDNGIKLASNKR